ncbi:MAG: J domain-containing protein [Ktedonobacteraceae bacterium]|nr:J domain-containing protein [Ktedonobacteraceae bacterium]
MNSSTDYYTLLGVARDASPAEIKSAFKRLALQYHPDVYKGEDAHERMRLLLQAYQTLNNPLARKEYDLKLQERGEGRHVFTGSAMPATERSRADVSARARRDRRRYYDFPLFHDGQPMRIDMIDIIYTLSANEARVLVQQGMLRGVAPETGEHTFFCHRCHHHWHAAPAKKHAERWDVPRLCPQCGAIDWPEYLLLHCSHCNAIFESEQIRYEIGSLKYGKKEVADLAALCPPYELFPLCPYCGRAHWCPAEELRLQAVRQRLARQTLLLRIFWISIAILFFAVAAGFVLLNGWRW